MRRNNCGRGKPFAFGLLIGSMTAGIAALLFAPKNGKQLRKDICDKYCDYSEKSQEVLKNAGKQAEELMDKARKVVKDARKRIGK